MLGQFHCPVCDTTENQAGLPLRSEWAVANHIAGKIHTWNDHGSHRAWARKHAPEADLHKRGLALARELQEAVSEASGQQSGPGALHAPARTLANIECLQMVELRLHAYVEGRLREALGADRDLWWTEGVPLQIRQGCAQRREEDPDRDELFAYAYLIDLKVILDKNWSLFEGDLSAIQSPARSKKEFLDQLTKLNDLRNRYAHPTRAPKSDSQRYGEDREFISSLLAAINSLSD